MPLVPSPQNVLILIKHLCSLPNYATVYNSLIIRLNSCSMMQDYYFSFKFINCVRMRILIYENHSLSEVVPLENILLIE